MQSPASSPDGRSPAQSPHRTRARRLFRAEALEHHARLRKEGRLLTSMPRALVLSFWLALGFVLAALGVARLVVIDQKISAPASVTQTPDQAPGTATVLALFPPQWQGGIEPGASLRVTAKDQALHAVVDSVALRTVSLLGARGGPRRTFLCVVGHTTDLVSAPFAETDDASATVVVDRRSLLALMALQLSARTGSRS